MSERTKTVTETVREKARVAADRAYVKYVCDGGEHVDQVTFGADAASDVWEQHVNGMLNGPQFLVLQCGWQHHLFWPEDMVPWPTTCDAQISEDGDVCGQPFRVNKGQYVASQSTKSGD